MANICNYNICVKGTMNSSYLVYYAMPSMDEKRITQESGTAEQFELWFEGDCKWSVNFGVSNEWSVDLSKLEDMDEGEIEELGMSGWDVSLGKKADMLHCEILVHYWSAESEFDQFDQYVNGECVKQRKISYHPEVYDCENGYEDEDCGDFNSSFRFSVGHIQQGERNQNVEFIRKGDRLHLKK